MLLYVLLLAPGNVIITVIKMRCMITSVPHGYSMGRAKCYVSFALSLCHALIFLLTCVPPDRFSAFYRTRLGHSRYLDT